MDTRSLIAHVDPQDSVSQVALSSGMSKARSQPVQPYWALEVAFHRVTSCYAATQCAWALVYSHAAHAPVCGSPIEDSAQSRRAEPWRHQLAQAGQLARSPSRCPSGVIQETPPCKPSAQAPFHAVAVLSQQACGHPSLRPLLEASCCLACERPKTDSPQCGSSSVNMNPNCGLCLNQVDDHCRSVLRKPWEATSAEGQGIGLGPSISQLS